MARGAALAGNDLIFVSTNDAWFGEEGCAEQHAAHSVLRAIETGLPVLRCGNAGWSGWIDPMGRKRDVLKDENGSIYFEGAGVITLHLKKRGGGVYAKMGDFFPVCCLLMVIFFMSWSLMRPRNSSKA